MQFEKNLALMRKRKGLSQDELAYGIGVSRQTIYSWEAGLNYPNILMLRKIANVLEVSTDDLLNGFEVNRLPKSFRDLKLSYVSRHEGKVVYEELPNWFIALKPGAEVSWAIYDPVRDEYVKDYSYHIETLQKVRIHGQEGVEIEVKEYDEQLTLTRKYSQYVSGNQEGIMFLGETVYEDGIKVIRTLKDRDFLKDWGYNGKPERQSTEYQDAENWLLEYEGRRHNVIRLAYFENNGDTYCEVFLNQKMEPLFWRRYTKQELKKQLTGQMVTVRSVSYDLDYCCLTSRL